VIIFHKRNSFFDNREGGSAGKEEVMPENQVAVKVWLARIKER